jgi:branched-chain amino acid aminotransferase
MNRLQATGNTVSRIARKDYSNIISRKGDMLSPIASAHITIVRSTDPSRYKSLPPKEDLKFGAIFSDHMLQVKFDIHGGGWSDPEIGPFRDLTLSPASMCLHYGMQCLEGMKAYRSLTDGSLRLFRPDMNMKRLRSSMQRLKMPGYDFDQEKVIGCIKALVRLDERWVPQGEGYSLYLRPTVIATHSTLRDQVPDQLHMFVIASPVGPYYPSGFSPVRLTADTSFVRAWPGGTGAAKVGG